MEQLSELAQSGVLSDPTLFAEYLTFLLKSPLEANQDKINDCLARACTIEKAINQKDTNANLSVTIGFSHHGWQNLFQNQPMPAELHPFPAMADGDRRFPSTAGDIFFMIKSQRMDFNFQVAKHIASALHDIASLMEDIQGYQYLDNRDMIDFVDGTENPVGNERIESVLVKDDIKQHQGGSYLVVQKYIDRQWDWDKQTTEYQEQVIGRSKMDNIELDDDIKPAWAHNAKSKVEIDGAEIKMLRQNRPFGNAMEYGTMFVGFAATPTIIETSLTQMIHADENGDYDRLLDFVEAKTGTLYFIPSQPFLNQFGD